MKKINCRLIFHSRVNHLNQLLCGFVKLNQMGLIDLECHFLDSTDKAILEVFINDSIKIIYDTMDEEIFYAAECMKIENIDYYFKRSFKQDLANRYSFKSYPLGLNYLVFHPKKKIIASKKQYIKELFKSIKGNSKKFFTEDFETLPIISENPKVMFLTRLWDINDKNIENDDVREERRQINQFRIECIKACRERFGNSFIGGIEDSNFARQYAPEYIVDKSLTDRSRFIDLIKEVDICIATTGLHSSIGWKFGEYVAASRAIISEPLFYELPGEFKENKNYITFKSTIELIKSIELLIVDSEMRKNMMWNNYKYYGNFVKPYRLIGNTLSIVFNNK